MDNNGFLLSFAYMFFLGVYYLVYITITKSLIGGVIFVLLLYAVSTIAQDLGEKKGLLNENNN
jgi:hypothetical protein